MENIEKVSEIFLESPKYEYYFDLLSGDPVKNGVRVMEDEFFNELQIPQTCTRKIHPGNVNRLDFYDGPYIIGSRLTVSEEVSSDGQ